MKSAKEIAEHLRDLDNDYYVEDLDETIEAIQQAREDGARWMYERLMAMGTDLECYPWPDPEKVREVAP